jgi:hypothetical protein
MNQPRVSEFPLPLARVERDDFADDPAPSMPNRAPYERHSQRDLVRASLDRYLNTNAYNRENGR